MINKTSLLIAKKIEKEKSTMQIFENSKNSSFKEKFKTEIANCLGHAIIKTVSELTKYG